MKPIRAKIEGIFLGFVVLVIISLFTISYCYAARGPVLLFSDLASGPKTGWNGSTTKGVAVTVWGENLGNGPDENSYVTVNGAKIIEYAEWGEDLGPARNLDRITFWLNSNCADGDGHITVTVDGITSNTLDFTVRPGNIYFVATDGSDSNDGSFANPCATIQHTVRSVMQPGDILYVRRGDYSEREIWIRDSYGHSGEPGKPKVIKNYPGENVRLVNGERPFIVSANYITISGLNFYNGKSIILGNIDSRGLKVVGCTFHGQVGYDAIGTHGNDIILAGNVADLEGASTGSQGHCFYISHGSNINILYNEVKGAAGYGIHIFDQRRSSQDIKRVIKDVLVEGNLILGSPYQIRSGMIIAMQDEGNLGNYIGNVTIKNNVFAGNNHVGLIIKGIAKNIYVYNNTFYQNGREAIYISGGSNLSNVIIKNNVFDQTSNTNCHSNCNWFEEAHIQIDSEVPGLAISNNLYYPSPPKIVNGLDSYPIIGDPRFVNPSNNDFSLEQGSAAIDTGIAIDGVIKDFDGNMRPIDGNGDGSARYDIGSFEYNSGNGPSGGGKPSAPTNLKVL